MTSENNSFDTKSGVSRRSLVRGAAWSIPVVAVAVATPLAAASDVEPPATDWYTGGSGGIASGNVMVYTLTGQDANGDRGIIPTGSTVTITALNGVTVEYVSATGATVVDNGDGTWTATLLPDVSAVELRFRATGPIGDAASFHTSVPAVAPYEEVFNIPITR